MSNKKKIVILSCMIALLVVTAVFNFVMTTSPVEQASQSVSGSANYFSQYRTERLTTRNEELLQLDQIINSAESNSEQLNQALSMKKDIILNTENELLLESLIKAYGFDDAVVVIGLESNNVNVIAKSQELTADDAVTIYTIINEEISVSPENIKIIPIS